MSSIRSIRKIAVRSFVVASLATVAFAAQPIVKTVPWVAADRSVPHETFAFKSVTLKGTASLQGSNIRATWDFGDGSAPATSAVTDSYNVSATHAYTGAPGTTYTARLTVTDQSTGEYSFADYAVIIREQSLETSVNVAIDEGLWYLHTSMNRTGATGNWQGTSCYACDTTGEATAWNVLAFERHGHVDIGDSADPYTETVTRAHAAIDALVAAQQPKGAIWNKAARTATAADSQAAAADSAPSGIDAVDAATLVARQNALGYWLGNNPAATAGFETAQSLFALSATPVIHLAGTNSVTNVSTQVQVTNTGFTFNRATGTYNGNLTVKNITGSTIAAPITVGITNLPGGVTLTNSNGTFNSAPYRSITALPLLAGASVSVPIIFSNPGGTAITFNRFTYSGNFPPAALTLACSANTGTVNTPYNSSLDANGGVQAYTYSISVGSLPAGLNINGSTGAITGTPTTAGNISFTALVTDSAGQNPQTASQPCNINVAPDTTPQTITFTSPAPAGATVGGATYTPTATATSGLPVTLTIDAVSAGVCSISGGIVSFQATGTCVVDANQAGNATYSAAPQVQQSFTVGKGNQTISFTSTAPVGATVGGTAYTVTATATSGLAVAFSIDASATAICSISGNSVSFLAVGTCVINANQAGNASYNAAPQVQQSFAVGKGNQTITFTSTPPATPTVGGPTYNVTATATSGLPVAFTIDASATSVCSISGATVTFLASGDCIINANQAGNANYNAATQAQQTIGVGKSSQTISFTSSAPGAAVVGGPTYNVTATATSTLTVTFTIDASATSVCSIAGSTVSFLAAGTCVINANQAGNASYNAAPQVQQSFTVGKGNQTISFTSAAPASATVGGSPYNVTATATSSLPVTFTIDASATAICSISGSTVSFLAAGTCVIDANQAGNANYNPATQVQQSFTVGKGNQTISFTSTAPVGATVGGTPYNVTATATSGLPVTFSSNTPTICGVSGSTVSFLAAGTCVINANQAGDANYNAAPQAQQSFAVAKGNQTITFTSSAPSNALVGGATYAVTATATSGLPVAFTIDASATAICSISGSTVSFLAGGTCVINANQAGNANYNAAVQVQQSFQVNQPPNITSANAVTFRPGLPGQSFTVTTTGFPSGASMVISESGALPSGVNFTNNNNGTATINGTPAAGTAGNSGTPRSQAYPFDITAANGIAPNDTQAFTLTIACPVITPAGANSGALTFNVAGSVGTYTQSTGSGTIVWSAANLPPGVSINSGSGLVSGTPTATGTYTATITATDAGACTGAKAVTVTVAPNLPAQTATGVGNTQFFVTGIAGAPTTPAVSSATGVLAGATPAGGITITNISCSVNGTIDSFDAAGRFIFTPAVSATTATCSYTGSSDTGGTGTAVSASKSLTFTLNNKVWYVSHGATGGNGVSNTPFGDFGASANQLNCVPTTSTSDFIYVALGTGGSTTGACVLKASQSLIGAGATLSVGGLLTVTGNAANTPTLTGLITLANNVTVNGIDMSTGSSAAITGTSITGVSVTPRDVATTSGTAVNIGGSGNTGTYSFRSISTNGATNGIIFTNNTGSFTVTGTGTTLGSGGTIQSADQGAQFTSMNNLTLKNMNFTNANSGNGTCNNVDDATFNNSCKAAINMSSVATAAFDRLVMDNAGAGQNGINGRNVSALTISNSSIKNFGDAVNENLMRLFNLTGASSFTNSTFQKGGDFLVDIRNDTGTLTLSVTGDTFDDTASAAFGAAGFSITSTGASTINLTVDGDNFTKIKNAGIQAFSKSTSTMNVDIINNIFDPAGGVGGGIGRGPDLNAANSSHMNFNINHNTKIYSKGGTAVNITSFGTAVIQGRVKDNADIRTGGVGSPGTGVVFLPQDNSTGLVEITGNTISQIGSTTAAGITVSSHGDGATLLSTQLDATISGNSITLINNGVTGGGYVGGIFGVQVQAGANTGDLAKTCADVRSNTVGATGGVPINGSENVAFRTRQGSSGSQLYLENMAAGANNSARALATWNANGNTPAFTNSSDAGGSPAYSAPPAGSPYFGVCRAPSNPTI